jgi:hypothetical protein
MNTEGRNAFMEYQVPRAVITLKQGAGRLIRDESDRGVLMICDTRIVTKPYGRRIWQSLPPMRRTRLLEDVEAFFSGAAGSQEVPLRPTSKPSPRGTETIYCDLVRSRLRGGRARATRSMCWRKLYRFSE